MDRDAFFAALWQDLVKIAPHAGALRTCFEAHGETVVNDHVAFRTFDRGPLALSALEPLLLALGYSFFEEYRFEDKKLRARSYLCEGSPRVFLSELLADELPAPAAELVRRCALAVAPAHSAAPSVFWAGRLWPALSFAEYSQLAEVSEYAAWLCALGMHANHFTVSINHLTKLTSVRAVVDFVRAQGMSVNASGGEIKGSPAELLEQASTLADRVPVEFRDGVHEIGTCYYEFALRYPRADGRLFDGFVPKSADKIFESTDRQT